MRPGHFSWTVQQIVDLQQIRGGDRLAGTSPLAASQVRQRLGFLLRQGSGNYSFVSLLVKWLAGGLSAIPLYPGCVY